MRRIAESSRLAPCSEETHEPDAQEGVELRRMANSVLIEALYSGEQVFLSEAMVKPEPSIRPDEEHRVLQFRPRTTRPDAGQPPLREPPASAMAPQSEGLAKYESHDDETDDYRHRMMVNLAALFITVVLAVAGAWLAVQIADIRKNQDCVLSGRSNCMRIETTAPRQP
jgi:hypothetical protein